MDPKAIDLYNEYIHGDLPRRSFLKKLAGIAGSAADVARVKVLLMMHYAGKDTRINQSIPEFRALLDDQQVAYSLHMYPGTGHGFHNDTSAARYDSVAAPLAWERSMNFFGNYLH